MCLRKCEARASDGSRTELPEACCWRVESALKWAFVGPETGNVTSR
jgi:hypothetical protein